MHNFNIDFQIKKLFQAKIDILSVMILQRQINDQFLQIKKYKHQKLKYLLVDKIQPLVMFGDAKKLFRPWITNRIMKTG